MGKGFGSSVGVDNVGFKLGASVGIKVDSGVGKVEEGAVGMDDGRSV